MREGHQAGYFLIFDAAAATHSSRNYVRDMRPRAMQEIRDSSQRQGIISVHTFNDVWAPKF